MAQKLFDKASLVMIPSQYKEGKIYNIKPEDQSSSFEFERGTAATRVNSSGLIEQTGVSSAELWHDDDILTSGTGSYADGVVTITASTGNDYVAFHSLDGVEAGNYYQLSFDVVANSGSFAVLQGTGNNFTPNYLISESGSYSRIVEYTHGAPNKILFYSNNSTAVGIQFDGTISNFSIKKVNIDTPRLDYSGTEPALLLEPQRTNLVTNSENYEASSWEKLNVDITPNNILSPSGKTDGLLLQDDATSGFHRLRTDSITSAGDYTFSLYAKAGTSDKILLYGYLGGGGIGFDLTNKTNFTVPGISSSGVNYGFGETLNGWTRIWIQVTYSINNPFAVFMVNQDGDAVSYSGNGDSIYIYGAQVEQGSYATSYIPTNGQAETRLKDVCYGGGYESVFNQTEGTLFIDLEKLAESTSEYNILSLFGDAQNYLWLGMNNNFNRFYVALIANGTPAFSSTGVDIGTSRGKVAIKYKSGDSKAYANGVNVYNNTNTFSFTTTLKELRFNYSNVPTSLNSTMKAIGVVYFPEALTDTELQQLTSNT